LKSIAITALAPPFTHTYTNKNTLMDVEACVPISGDFPVPNEDLVTTQTLPAQCMAVAVYKGSHAEAESALKSLLKDVEESGEWTRVEGLPIREIVTNGAPDGIDWSNCVVEYLVPVIKK
jgi:effector-binding domain-containing protein